MKGKGSRSYSPIAESPAASGSNSFTNNIRRVIDTRVRHGDLLATTDQYIHHRRDQRSGAARDRGSPFHEHVIGSPRPKLCLHLVSNWRSLPSSAVFRTDQYGKKIPHFIDADQNESVLNVRLCFMYRNPANQMRHLLLSTDKLRINNVIIAGLLIYATANFAGAQERDSIPVQQQASSKSAQEDVKPKAVPLGSFLLYPDLTVSGVYDDNIFATPPRTEEDDYIMIVSPSALIKSQWSKHELSLGAGADIGRYATNSDEDYEDYWVEADGRYDFAARSNVFGGTRFIRDHEDRASPDDVNGVEPTTFDEYGGHAGLFHQIKRTAMRPRWHLYAPRL